MPAWYVKRSRTGLIATTDQVGADEYVAEPFASQDDALAWIELFKCRRETRRNVWGMVFVFALLAGVGLMGPSLVQAATSSFQPTINKEYTSRGAAHTRSTVSHSGDGTTPVLSAIASDAATQVPWILVS